MTHRICLLLFATLVSLFIFGCEEKDVPFVIDADEILAYLSREPEAKELFSLDGLYPTGEYVVDHQFAVYSDRILSHKRTVSVELVPLERPDYEVYADYGSLGLLREAWAVVTDKFTIETTRIIGEDTLVDTTNRPLERFAFFLKLGSDSKDYLGWRLWGYRGISGSGGPLATTVRMLIDGEVQAIGGDIGIYTELPLSRSSYIRTLAYVRLSDIPKPDPGELMSLETNWIGNQTITIRDYPLVAYEGESGHVSTTLTKLSREQYRGAFDVRENASRRYNFFFMQSLHDDEFFHVLSWCIPYQQ